MPDQDELPFSVALSERVHVEFSLMKRDDGQYRVPYHIVKKQGTSLPFVLDPNTFDNINEARRSIVDQAKKQVAAGLTGDLDDAIDIGL
jgi:hypothetical protein